MKQEEQNRELYNKRGRKKVDRKLISVAKDGECHGHGKKGELKTKFQSLHSRYIKISRSYKIKYAQRNYVNKTTVKVI